MPLQLFIDLAAQSIAEYICYARPERHITPSSTLDSLRKSPPASAILQRQAALGRPPSIHRYALSARYLSSPTWRESNQPPPSGVKPDRESLRRREARRRTSL